MDISKYGDIEQVIIKAFEKNEFEKNGVRETCRRIEAKHGYSVGTTKKIYSQLNKYGAFQILFPERFGIVIKVIQKYTPFATRLKVENIEALDDLAKMNGKSKQQVVNDLIEKAYADEMLGDTDVNVDIE